MFRLEGVGRRYGRGRWALVDIDLTVPPGATVAVVGDNGAGKSTLLRIAAGVLGPSRGRVLCRPAPVGYVPERFPVTTRMSALAYLRHLGRVRGLGTATATRRAEELLERLALTGDPTGPLNALSKGNAQKVALAQALLISPELLVLDEPWSGLDAVTHPVVVDMLAEVRAAGCAVLLTDHAAGVTRVAASAVHRLHRGRLVLNETPLNPAEPVFRVELAGGGDLDWLSTLDIRAMDQLDGHLTVQIEAGHRHALLQAALEHGWLVESLTRVGGAGQ
ncbi:ABC transporter ATP-binding protein [Longimycelium tulufanense]|uniref:ABC transporter ATP-binding protein n=1 Tax=Longimycelium tulufanense TaxID=907463 RepID=A0A8J3C7E7_9PSEU|nr:ABC transporter ATP-binding protein [Longimycelium tulufanense]GGM35048.1 ABC transporter ATP-binding protein [Longimycelium tulufanense]